MSCHRLQISLLNFSKRVKKFVLSKPCKLTLKFTQSCPPMNMPGKGVWEGAEGSGGDGGRFVKGNKGRGAPCGAWNASTEVRGRVTRGMHNSDRGQREGD